MITPAQRIRLGLFVAVCLLILLGLVAAIVGRSFWEKRDHYTVRYDVSVSGLEVGAPVKYNGVRVGRVESTSIDPEKVSQTIVAFSLDAGTPIKENTRATLNVQGITGLKFIELVGGTSEAKTLAPGSEVQAGASAMESLTGQAEAISLKVDLLASRLLDLTSDHNRALVSTVLERASTLMNTVDQTVEKNADQVNKLITNLSTASENFAGFVAELRATAVETREAVAGVRRSIESMLDNKHIGGLVDDTRAAVGDVRRRLGDEDLGKATKTLNQLLNRLNTMTEKIDTLVVRSQEDIRTTFRFLSETAENLRDFSRLVREDPTRLLKSPERRERQLP
jgi:phospholipid/cholesterol/gamma-HCH transport system substrate-binding protein